MTRKSNNKIRLKNLEMFNYIKAKLEQIYTMHTMNHDFNFDIFMNIKGDQLKSVKFTVRLSGSPI